MLHIVQLCGDFVQLCPFKICYLPAVTARPQNLLVTQGFNSAGHTLTAIDDN